MDLNGDPVTDAVVTLVDVDTVPEPNLLIPLCLALASCLALRYRKGRQHPCSSSSKDRDLVDEAGARNRFV